MISYLRNNFHFIIALTSWVLISYLIGMPAMGVVGVFMLLFAQRQWLEELFIGFVFILILSDNLSGSVDFAKNFKNVYILFLTYYLLVQKDFFTVANGIYKYFIPFFIFAIIGIAYSPVIATAIQKTVSYFILLWIMPHYIVTNYKRSGPEFFRNLVLFLVFICIVGYLFRFINPGVAFSHGGRFRGVFGNPNGMGIFLITVTVLFEVVRQRFPSLFTRGEVILIFVLILYFVLISGSRNALMSILLFFMFGFFFRISAILGFIMFMVVAVLTEYVTSNFISIISSLGLGEQLRVETLKEGSGRLVAWEFAWKEIQRSIFIGRGMGYDEYYMRLNAPILTDLGHEGGVHNSYLIIWLNTGLCGLLCFFAALFTIFIKAFQRNKLAFPALIAVLFSINFEPWIAASLNPYTIILIIIVTLLKDDIFYEDNLTDQEITDEDEIKETFPA